MRGGQANRVGLGWAERGRISIGDRRLGPCARSRSVGQFDEVRVFVLIGVGEKARNKIFFFLLVSLLVRDQTELQVEG